MIITYSYLDQYKQIDPFTNIEYFADISIAVAETPPCRIISILSEDRTTNILSENRTVIIPFENRTVTVICQ